MIWEKEDSIENLIDVLCCKDDDFKNEISFMYSEYLAKEKSA